MGQLQIDNPEKLATQGTEDDKKKYMRRISPHANKTRLTSYSEFTPMACFDTFHVCYSRRILLPAILIGFQLCKTAINTKLYFKPQIGAIYVNLFM
jgi:hypothetical protein